MGYIREDYSFAELFPMAVIGVIGGLLGALFNQLTLYITSWRQNHLHKKGSRVKIVEACLVSLLTSVISFGLPLLRKCSPCPEPVPQSGIECPRRPGMYGNYVNVVSFPRVVKVADVVSILQSNKHNGFPVIDHTRSGETLVIGLVLRGHLLVILQSKVDFQHSPLPSDPRGGARSINKGLHIDDIHLSSDDLEMYIDLAPFLNPSPYIVPEDMSLTKVYNLFRQLGLRHLFVVPRPSRVLGLITRKDLLIEDKENVNPVELQSTSMRIRHRNKKSTRNEDEERPLLNSLLVQDQISD